MAPADTPRARRARLLGRLYGDRSTAVAADLDTVLDRWRRAPRSFTLDESDTWVIAYPDHLTAEDGAPLATLGRVVARHLAPAISGVHTLPVHPASGDGGFSVIDPAVVDPRLGDWADLARLAEHGAWMADAVVNHLSASSPWFTGFLAGDARYADSFVRVATGTDTSAVVRPRTTPLAHEFATPDGRVERVWTTFSADQVDLDYRNPHVMVAMVEVLARYVHHGAQAIRLDAVAFLWKDAASPSIHLGETHAVVQLLRACLDEIAPDVLVITETNVPHAENVSYLGDDATPEADAVYQFALPPLVLHAMLTGDAAPLVDWAGALEFPAGGQTFLNFLASHDGVGVRPVEHLLGAADIAGLATATSAAGGVVNHRSTAEGESPYELAAAWFELMAVGHTEDEAIARHVASHAIALALRGVPLLYLNSLFGIGHDRTTFERTNHARDLNRQRLRAADLERHLTDPGSRASKVWGALRGLLDARRSDPAFHPAAAQIVHAAPPGIVVVERVATGGARRGARSLVAVDVSGDDDHKVELPAGTWVAVDGERHAGQLHLGPWDVAWLRRR